jgi:hypothetical protein
MDLPLVPQPKKYDSEDSFVGSCLKNIALSLEVKHKKIQPIISAVIPVKAGIQMIE